MLITLLTGMSVLLWSGSQTQHASECRVTLDGANRILSANNDTLDIALLTSLIGHATRCADVDGPLAVKITDTARNIQLHRLAAAYVEDAKEHGAAMKANDAEYE